MSTPQERLKSLLAAVKIAVAVGQIQAPGNAGFIGVGYRNKEGAGALVASFESDAFVRDLEAVLSPKPETRPNFSSPADAYETDHRKGIYWLGGDRAEEDLETLIAAYGPDEAAELREAAKTSDIWVWFNPYSQEISGVDALEWATSEAEAQRRHDDAAGDV